MLIPCYEVDDSGAEETQGADGEVEDQVADGHGVSSPASWISLSLRNR